MPHSWRQPMGQSKPLRATALVVEDDPMQREMICLLLEESEMDVIECESAEAAARCDPRGGKNVAGLAPYRRGLACHWGRQLARLRDTGRPGARLPRSA